jgi:hypothetical protein
MFEIERLSEQTVAPKPERINWPWKNMEVGDLVRITDPQMICKAQVSCHVYRRFTEKKFQTRTIDQVLHVWRIE